MKQFNYIWYDDSVNAYIFLYLNYLSKMKVPKAMLLDQVMNEGNWKQVDASRTFMLC